MQSLPKDYRAIVFGSSGGIGAAFVEQLKQDPHCGEVIGLSRSTNPGFDLTDEASIEAAAGALDGPFHLVIVATGILSDEMISPEKALRALEPGNLSKLFEINAIGPSMIMKHFTKKLPRDQRSIMAVLSARVGSIGDNGLGGWYSYRASKSALNMLMKCTAIEIGRLKPEAVIASLHPGTVVTSLSEPFASDRERLDPEQSTSMMLQVLDNLGPDETGSFWDYCGERVEW